MIMTDIYIVLQKLMKYRKYEPQKDINETNLVLNITEELTLLA